MAPSVRVYLLGGLKVKVDGVEVQNLLRKNEALFAYLVAERRPHARESLAALLWSDKNNERAQGNLRTALASLAGLSEFVVSQRYEVSLRPNVAVWVDVHEFEQLIQLASHSAGSAGLLTDSARQALEDAVALYQGSFLEGFSLRHAEGFDEWTRAERERWQLAFIQVLHRLVAHYLATEQYQTGIQWARRLVQLDPANEEANLDLMRMLAGSGQTAAAMSQYENLTRRLRDEGERPPSALIQLLADQLQTGQVANALLSVPVSANQREIPNNLTTPLTPIVGRTTELRTLTDRITDERCRLMTLAGPGGIGKTRLVIEAGLQMLENAQAKERFSDGIFFVRLESVNSVGLLPAAIAEAVGCNLQGVIAPDKHICNFLRNKRMLLILDNTEQIPTARQLITQILLTAAHVKVLVTSLDLLNLQGEWLMQLSGLSFPAGPHTAGWRSFPAIELFALCAEAVRPNLDVMANQLAITQICQYVQGMPLGIQLAGAATRAYSCQRIADELAKNLDFLSSKLHNLPERHRSLRAIFEYVWRLLNDFEREAIANLSIFIDGFSENAAIDVAGVDPTDIMALLDHSLLYTVQIDNPAAPGGRESQNYYRIHGSLQSYLREHLSQNASKFEEIRRHHTRYYMDFLWTRGAALDSPRVGVVLREIRQEIANIHAAWDYAVATRAVDKLALGQFSLSMYYYRHGPFQEGIDKLSRAIDVVNEYVQQHPNRNPQAQAVLCQLLVSKARFHNSIASYAEAQKFADQAASLAKAIDNREIQAEAALQLGRSNYYLGNYATAHAQLQNALEIAIAEELLWVQTQVRLFLGSVCAYQNDYVASRTHLDQGMAICRQRGDTLSELQLYREFARIAIFTGDYSAARDYYELIKSKLDVLGDRNAIGINLVNLGVAADHLGYYEDAHRYYLESFSLMKEMGDYRTVGTTLGNLSLLSFYMDKIDDAQNYGQQGLEHATRNRDRDVEAYLSNILGYIYASQGKWEEAQGMHERSLKIRRELQQPAMWVEPTAGLAEAALAQGEPTRAQALVESLLVWFAQNGTAGVLGLMHVFIICYRVLQTSDELRAEGVLRMALCELKRRASQITDPQARQSYLKNVYFNRQLGELANQILGEK